MATKLLSGWEIPNAVAGQDGLLASSAFLAASPPAQDAHDWIRVGCFLLFVAAATAAVYLFKVVEAWTEDHANTELHVTVFGCLWVLLCLCVMGMDYLSSFLPRGPMRKAANPAHLRGSMWAYGAAIGSVAILLAMIGAMNLYRRWTGRKKGKKASYHLRRKEDELHRPTP